MFRQRSPGGDTPVQWSIYVGFDCSRYTSENRSAHGPKQMQEPSAAIVGRFLRTGDLDDPIKAWLGENWLARAKQIDAAWREALVSAVTERVPNATAPAELAAMNITAFARKKAEPMVRGLFPQIEQENVLALLERSLVFLSPATIGPVLMKMPWPSTAWNLANLYLASYGAEPLSRDALGIVGLSEETTCYVSVGYFVSAMRLPLLRFRPPFAGLAREPRVRFSSSTAEAPPVDGFWSGRRRRARGHL